MSGGNGPDIVGQMTEWADKNKDKLDKCMVVQTGAWFSKGQLLFFSALSLDKCVTV